MYNEVAGLSNIETCDGPSAMDLAKIEAIVAENRLRTMFMNLLEEKKTQRERIATLEKEIEDLRCK